VHVTLKPVTRDNWEEALRLRVHEQQAQFVPEVAVSIAKVHIKPDGDQVCYLPFAVYNGDAMVGFIMHAYEEGTTDMYWINGFLIDKAHQGKGYGKAALAEMVRYIFNRFPQSAEVRLTVNVENHAAQHLYKSFGFIDSGNKYHDEIVFRYLR